MEITFCEMRDKEIINLFDGKRLGRVVDLVFDCNTNEVRGIVVPGIKRFFARRSDDIFIPLCLIQKIGEDVILVSLTPSGDMPFKKEAMATFKPDHHHSTPKIREAEAKAVEPEKEKGFYSQFVREINRD